MEGVEGTKRCYKCGETKPLGAFAIDRSRKDGKQPRCRACIHAYREQNLDRLKEYRKDYYWRDVEDAREKTRAWLSKNGERSREAHRCWRERNKEQIAQKRHEAYLRDPEKKKSKARRHYRVLKLHAPDKIRAWTENRRARVKNAPGSFTQAEWRDLCVRFGNRCLACGEHKPLTVDHVVPLSKGGSNDISNIQPLCWKCNNFKRARIIDYRMHARVTSAVSHEANVELTNAR